MILRLVCDRQKGAVIKALSEEYKFTQGSWEEYVQKEVSGYWMFRPVSQSIWDMKFAISPEYISGANNSSMSPASMDLSYAGEELYNATRLSVSLGSIALPSRCEHMYFKFAEPVNARYIGLNNMVAKSKYYSCKDFYIYTQNE